MSSSILLAPLLLFAAAPTSPARGDAAQRAEAAFTAGDYDTAAEAAAEAYVAEGDPIYLYVRAQAERFGGHCEPAIEHYRQFIEAVPRGEAAEAARANIAECEEVLAKAAPAPVAPLEPTEPEPPVETEPDVEASDASDRGPHWIRDPLGGALVGAGVVVLAVGGGLYGQAKADERSAMQASNVVDYGERIDRAYALSRAGIPVMVIGGALVVGGVVRWVVLARRGQRERSSARFARFAQGLQPAVGGLVLRF